jgi:hypothetical protein
VAPFLVSGFWFQVQSQKFKVGNSGSPFRLEVSGSSPVYGALATFLVQSSKSKVGQSDFTLGWEWQWATGSCCWFQVSDFKFKVKNSKGGPCYL